MGRASNRKKTQRQTGGPNLRLVDALIAASYTREDPAGGRPLHQRLNLSDNPLELLADDVLPRDILPVGLLMLSTLARLCQNDSGSLLERP